MTKRGKLIVFEGGDRSGKSTQAQLLGGVQMKFPNRTTSTGKIIDEFLRNKIELNNEAIHLLFAANRWESVSEITEQLKLGNNVVIDRYSFSGIAYSMAKGLSEQFCKSSEVSLPMPDVVFYIKVSQNHAQMRNDYGQERFEIAEFQEKVYMQFEALKNEFKFIEINGEHSIEEIHEFVKMTVDNLKVGELQYLNFK